MKPLQVSDAAAGRAGKCPHCKGAIQVPLASVPAAPAAITSSPAPMAPAPAAAWPAAASAGPADGGFAKAKSPWPLVGAAVGGGSLVVLAVLLIVLFFAGGSGGSGVFRGFSVDPMLFLPDNTQGIAVIRVDEFLNSNAYKELKAASKDVLPAGGPVNPGDIEKSAEEMGIASDNIALMTIAMDVSSLLNNASNPDAIMIVQTKSSVTADELKSKIKNKTFTEAKAGSYTYYEAPDEKQLFGQSKPGAAFAVVDKRTVVYAPKTQIKKLLERGKRPEMSESMQQAMRELGTPRTIGFAMSLKELVGRPDVKAGTGQLPPQAQQFVGDLQAFVLQVGVGNDVDVSAVVLMSNEKSAEDLRKMLDGFLALGKLAGGKDMPKEVTEILESIKLESKGNRMSGVMQLKTAAMVKLTKASAKKGPAPLPF